jgi:hypothetical protein
MKYEYKIYEADQGIDAKCTEWALNDLGQQGLELLFVAYNIRPGLAYAYYHFKRTITDDVKDIQSPIG